MKRYSPGLGSPAQRTGTAAPRARATARPQQRGMALIIALILLAAMTVISAATLRTVTLEQKVTNAAQDRALAFQAAEAVLRYAEGLAAAQASASPVNGGFPNQGLTVAGVENGCAQTACTGGMCEPPDPDCPPRWLDPAFAGWGNAPATYSGVWGTPQYIVEILIKSYDSGNPDRFSFWCSDGGSTDPKNCKRYRITVRSNANSERAAVILQSVYATE